MAVSSQKFVFDNRLLAVEELFRQRKLDAARQELALLENQEFAGDDHQQGLLLSLRADAAFEDGHYRQALDLGHESAGILANLPFNQRYARTVFVISKAYLYLGDLKNAETRAHDALAAYRRARDVSGQIDGFNTLARIAFTRSDYPTACGYLDEAIKLAGDIPRKAAQLRGNAGRIRILQGEWSQAEQDLRFALDYNQKNDEKTSQVVNLLSLGYLHMRRRELVFADRCLTSALELIDDLGMKRERVIYLEYAGELALEKGDIYRAKALLTEAYTDGRRLAPDSTLVSQTGRRLAEVELTLDNIDEAMKYGQKALELAVKIGEQTEVGLSKRVIARAFAMRSDFADALEYAQEALEIVRGVGDPYDLARTLIAVADLMIETGSDEVDRIRQLFDEAERVFKKLRLDYWVAETDYRIGVYACQRGDLSRGFKKLSRSEKVFAGLAESAKVRRVNQFLTSLADEAVALSISEENEFKLVGRLVNRSEVEDLKSGQMDEILRVLQSRTGADRVIILAPDFDEEPLTSSFEMTDHQARRFSDNFRQMLGEEISTVKPTLRLDCRRDPYLNDLFPDVPDVVASVMVVPFTMSDSTVSYIYLDRLSINSSLNPFSQEALNFAVGFSDIIAFKSAELQRTRLLEDNRRLKAQLMREAAFPNIITQNHQMLAMLAQVRQIVDSNISVAIEGATGCGKDLLARAIHYNSVRRNARFLTVNCAALPETLLESELFGYHKGAFTGADRDKPGLFEDAHGGTFFLDEIADMPLSVQAKILRVLEEKEIVRLGESIPRKVDVRIVSATNKDLKVEMANGRFRQDLYYRLSALTFQLPSLAQRREDIPLLVEHFLDPSGKKVSPESMRCLVNYDWPGNVRELENEVKKMILLTGDSAQIEKEVLSSKIISGGDSKEISEGAVPAFEEVNFDGSYSLYDYLAAHERRFIVQALKERKGVKKHAAAFLNIPESTLRLKIKEYDIDLKRLDSIN